MITTAQLFRTFEGERFISSSEGYASTSAVSVTSSSSGEAISVRFDTSSSEATISDDEPDEPAAPAAAAPQDNEVPPKLTAYCVKNRPSSTDEAAVAAAVLVQIMKTDDKARACDAACSNHPDACSSMTPPNTPTTQVTPLYRNDNVPISDSDTPVVVRISGSVIGTITKCHLLGCRTDNVIR